MYTWKTPLPNFAATGAVVHADDEHVTLQTWHRFVNADVFIMGKSSLSFTAAFFSSGTIYYPFNASLSQLSMLPESWRQC